ncbi:MAG: DUF3997 domain-containing protein [Tumebacillaceae bacterium]
MEDYSYKVAGEYSLIRSSAHSILVSLPENGTVSNTIPPKVIKIAWNDRYVIAEQQALIRRSPNDPNDLYELPDDKFYYWILDTKVKKAYGPYTEYTFKVKKKELKIPDSLILKDVNSYPKDTGEE